MWFNIHMHKVTKFLSDLIFKGKIPGLKYIRLILSLVPLLTIIILFRPQLGKDFANYGWNILVVTLYIRPISTILPKLEIICRMMLIRKQLGIIAGTFILTHGLGMLLINKMPISTLFSPQFWNFKTFIVWGLLGAIMVIPPRSEYVNLNKRVLHLFYCLDRDVLPDFTRGGGTLWHSWCE